MKPHRLVQVMMEPAEIIQKKKATFKIHCMCWVDVCFYYFIILQTDRWRIKQASLRFERKMKYLVVPDKFSASHSRELPFFLQNRDSWFALVLDCKKNLSQELFKSFEFSRQKLKKKKYGAHNTRAPFF